MDKYSSQILLPFSFIITTFLFTPVFLSQFHVVADKMYNSCAPFNCGNFLNISYPFWNLNTQPSYCGHPKFMLDCQNEDLTIEIKSQKFHILHIDQTSKVLRIAREDLWAFNGNGKPLCPKHYTNVDIDFHFFNYTSNNEIYTMLYECGGPFPDSYYSPSNQCYFKLRTCLIKGETYIVYIVSSAKLADFGVMKCNNSTTVPGKRSYLKNNSIVPTNVLEGGFEVRWNVVGDDMCHNCIKHGGRCIYKRVENTVLCLSKESTIPKGTWSWKTKLTVGVISSMLATLVIASICIYRRRNNNSSAESYIDSPSISQQLTERISKSQNYGVEHFIFDDLNVATEHFSVDNRLGDGGSGEVFRGKLPDGREVAVKRLFDTGNKQDLFLNEIKILAKVKHDNLVLLYGCTSLKSREPMVVYEYVSNGTLHELLHGDQTTSKKLPWDTRMRIAVETADALKYLHTYKVVHRDVKTSNILLTADCHVKVADFGLSRIFLVDESRVLTTAQGTPGCVDPEYQDTNVLTYKSDVFSFGVVLMELITCLCAYDDISRKGDDIFLYKMAVDRIQNHALTDIVDSTLNFNSDSKENQMINGVADLAVSCLQISSDRPTMAKVFESLLKIQGVNELHPEAASSSNRGDEIKLLNNDQDSLFPS